MDETVKPRIRFLLLSLQRIRHLHRASKKSYEERYSKPLEGEEKTVMTLFIWFVVTVNLVFYFCVLCGVTGIASLLLTQSLNFKNILILGLAETIAYLLFLSVKDELTGEWSEDLTQN